MASPFTRLWAADTVNHLGTAVRVTAIPLTAVTVLAAPPWQLGLLTAAATAAYLVIGLPAGVWVDRWPRRRVLIGANLGRAALLTSIPVAGWAGVLGYAQLVIVALLVGVMTVLFDVASPAMAQSVLATAARAGANSKMQSTQASTRLSGPPLTGLIAQLTSAATATGLSGLAYLGSALLARGLPDLPLADRANRRDLRAEILTGLRFTFGEPVLGALAASAAAYNFCFNLGAAVQVLFLSATLGQPAVVVGVLLAANGLGQVLGAATAGVWVRRLGAIRAMVLIPLVTQPFLLLIPLARPGVAIALFAVGALVAGYGLGVDNVVTLTVRQDRCPETMFGRMAASSRFVSWGVMPLGALTGGLLGELIGVRSALWIASAGAVLPCCWLWWVLRHRMSDGASLQEVVRRAR